MTVTKIQIPLGKATPKLGANRLQAGVHVIPKSKLEINSTPISTKGSVNWGYSSGVQPQKVTIITTTNYAQELVTKINADKGRVKINMVGKDVFSDGLIDETFTGLSMLPRKPSKHTHDKITIVDDRWRWPNKNVYKTYNLIRKANDLFVFKSITTAVQPTLHEAKNYYVDWTINPVTQLPWTAVEIVEDILVNFLGYAAENVIRTFTQKSLYIPGNIVLSGDQAHSVISRFMSLADINMYVDKDSKIILYEERTSFGQKEFDRHIANSIVGKVSGDMWVVDRKSIRPTDVFVSAEREFELLLSYIETGASASGSQDPPTTDEEGLKQIDNQQIFLENVTTTVVDGQVGTLPLGTIVTIEDALASFGLKFGSAKITLDKFRTHYGILGSAVFSSVLQNPQSNVEFDPKAITAWNAIVRDYRTKFRVPQAALKFMKSLKNVLVDIVNPESGKRAPSQVFSTISWVVKVSARQVSNRTHGIHLDSFSNLKAGDKFKPVPMVITDIDMDFGTFTVTNLGDVNQPGSITDTIRGRPKDSRFFNDQFAEGETALDRNSLYGNHGLQGDWEMSVIVSCVMLPRSSKTMYWTKTERPSKVKEGKGPALEIHSNYDTARFALSASNLKNYRGGKGDDFVNSDLIGALHKQVGNRRWVTFADQTEGDIEFAVSQEALKLRPVGPIGTIKHSFNVETGAYNIGVTAVPISQGRSIRNILGDDVLEVIFKQVKFDTSVGTR